MENEIIKNLENMDFSELLKIKDTISKKIYIESQQNKKSQNTNKIDEFIKIKERYFQKRQNSPPPPYQEF